MTILLLDQFGELGGAQLCLLDLVPALRERGWDVRAALPGDGELVRRLRRLDVPVGQIACGPYHNGRKSFTDVIRFLRDIAVTARRLSGAGLIYVNGPRLLPAVAAARVNCPVVFHAHSFPDKNYAVHLAAWSAGIARATVISSSRYAAVPFRSVPVRIVDNGVADFRRRRGPRMGPWRLGVIGRIAPEKGQLEFVRAARILMESNANCRFVICGAPSFSDPSYLVRVKAEAQGLPVEFAGWSDDVAAVLAELDVLVVPSRRNEATPRVIPEAFSAEVVVVASRTGGITELVTDGFNGFLAAPALPEALADTLRRVLAADLDDIRSQARACWEERFTLTRYQESVCAVLEECLPRKSTWKQTAAANAVSAAMPRGKE